MWYYLTPLIYLYPYVISNPQNTSNIIRTYDQHSELTDKVPVLRESEAQAVTDAHVVFVRDRVENTEATTGVMMEEVSEDVIFIPHDKEVSKGDGDYNPDMVRMQDMTVQESNGSDFKSVTEPNKDIIFISGKNAHDGGRQIDVDTVSGKETTNKIKLDCSNLNCNNTINSVCGKKIERKKWRHRLFLNECFFRKVNCHFRHEGNRYLQVPVENCKYTGIHITVRPYLYDYKPMLPPVRPEKLTFARRSFSSRRSQAMGINGLFCSHPCPVNCPEDYDPQCAISGTGQKQVFTNHCKMDYNSCFYGVVWHMRPLSQCVGGKKADMQQNRGFISWMQRIGIVDNKGKLNLS